MTTLTITPTLSPAFKVFFAEAERLEDMNHHSEVVVEKIKYVMSVNTDAKMNNILREMTTTMTDLIAKTDSLGYLDTFSHTTRYELSEELKTAARFTLTDNEFKKFLSV